MATKHIKLYEHGVGPRIVTPSELAKMKEAPSFKKVFREDGPATEAEVAAHNSASREAGKPVEPEVKAQIANPTGQRLPSPGQKPA